MHSDRLLLLAELLEADAVKADGIKFDIGIWGSAEGQVSQSCGTTACAMGLAVLSGKFEQYGLYNSAVLSSQILPAMKHSEYDISTTGFDAGAELFGITFPESTYLFYDGTYPEDSRIGAKGELAVATRIREFVADKRAGG